MVGMTVAESVGGALARWGVEAVFGLMGSGNLTFTNALRDGGARVYGARHEGGATSMADGYARVTGRVGVVSVHQGPGVTNTITALTEAAKSRTPLLVLAPDVPASALRSNFRIDQTALAESVGAVVERVHGPRTALTDAARAYARARNEQRAVVLLLPLDIQAMPCEQDAAGVQPPEPLLAPTPAPDAIARVAELLAGARQPAIVGGRGAVRAGAGGDDLRALGQRSGAILATSAVANGLFAGDPYSVGIAGGFSSGCGAEMLRACDLVVSFGATMNQWTTRHGRLIGPGARVVQVDLDADGIGGHLPVDVGVVGDARAAARALLAATEERRDGDQRWRTPETARRIASGRMRDKPYEDTTGGGRIDPRTLTIALDDLLPAERAVAVDSGHFLGYPTQYLTVGDVGGFLFPNAFQCVGLGLATGIGAALADPGRLTVAAVGDGGLLMALPELETLGRLRLPMLVLVYNDAAYGAEVHHFRSLGQAVDLAQFPDTDIAALARAAGCQGTTVREVADLDAVAAWLERRDGPLLVDAKVDPTVCAEWLEEAFRVH
jgi:thiamine pyrophosphate-dependent acetolactate synthase large subunit-like protein